MESTFHVTSKKKFYHHLIRPEVILRNLILKAQTEISEQGLDKSLRHFYVHLKCGDEMSGGYANKAKKKISLMCSYNSSQTQMTLLKVL